jgi:hypothetical protein
VTKRDENPYTPWSDLGRELLEEAIKRYGQPVEGRFCLCALVTKGCRRSECIKLPVFPCNLLDHPTRFVREGVTTAIISQPYDHVLQGDDIATARACCADLGLDLRVSASSWYQPGHTVALVFTKKGDD